MANNYCKGKDTIKLSHGKLSLPAFLPDATYGIVRSLDSNDLLRCGVQALMMNSFHLMQHPGTSVIKKMGGLHKLFGWNHPIVTDSGGFQAYSLIRQNSKHGTITDDGIIFRPNNSSKKLKVTPEKIIQLQLSFGTDVAICLDECTHVDDSIQLQKISTKRTIDWARKCKIEYERLLEQQNISKSRRPLLYAVVQGGSNRELRKKCADALMEIGFDGYGYGGYPIDSEGNLLNDMMAYTRDLIPNDFPMIALGVGKPLNIVKSYKMGYSLFDCSLPTRDARRGRLSVFTTDCPDLSKESDTSWHSYLYIQDKKYIKSANSISKYCNCDTCSRYSLSFLHHLFKKNDPLFPRLATIHNLKFTSMLLNILNKNLN